MFSVISEKVVAKLCCHAVALGNCEMGVFKYAGCGRVRWIFFFFKVGFWLMLELVLVR